VAARAKNKATITVRRSTRATTTGFLKATAKKKLTFEQALKVWEEQEMKEDYRVNRAAERLSASDLAIRVNAKA
jgi:hypothetical protein